MPQRIEADALQADVSHQLGDPCAEAVRRIVLTTGLAKESEIGG